MSGGAPWGDREIRVGMVGTGFVAPFHAAGWRACPGVRLTAAVVRDPDRGARRAAELGIERVYGSLEDLIAAEDPDVIDICSPADAHAQHVMTACAAGLAFMCQKPLAADPVTARSILDATRRAGVRAMVHENFRFRIWYRELKRALDTGVVGKPFYARSAHRMAGTVLTADNPSIPWSIERQPYFATADPLLVLESVIHQIDVARFLFGEPRSLFARARRVSSLVKGEDHALLTLCFDDMDVLIERSYASKGHAPPASGHGESMVVEGDAGTAFLSEAGVLRLVRDGPGGRAEILPAFDTRDAYRGSYAACIAHFVDGLRRGTPFETSLEDNLKTLSAVFAAYESVRRGQTVDLSFEERTQ